MHSVVHAPKEHTRKGLVLPPLHRWGTGGGESWPDLPELRSGRVRAGSRPGRPAPQSRFLITARWSPPCVVQNSLLRPHRFCGKARALPTRGPRPGRWRPPLVLLLPPWAQGWDSSVKLGCSEEGEALRERRVATTTLTAAAHGRKQPPSSPFPHCCGISTWKTTATATPSRKLPGGQHRAALCAHYSLAPHSNPLEEVLVSPPHTGQSQGPRGRAVPHLVTAGPVQRRLGLRRQSWKGQLFLRAEG